MQWFERIQQKLKEKGWSAAELARRSGVSEHSIWKYLQGRTAMPRGETLAKIASALGTSKVWLMHGDVQPPENALAIRQIPLANLGGYDGRADTLPQLIQDADEFIPVSADIQTLGETIAVRIYDSAMAAIPAGSVVVVDLGRPPEPGRYVLAYSRVLKATVARRWRAADYSGAGMLMSDSQDFPPLPMSTPADGHVIGRILVVLTFV